MGMTHSTIRRHGCIVSSYQRRFPVVYLLGGQCEGLELRIGNSRSALCSCTCRILFDSVGCSSKVLDGTTQGVDRQSILSVVFVWMIGCH